MNTKKVQKYVDIKQAAKFCGIGLSSMYNAVHDKDIIPDITLFREGTKEVKKYLFSIKTLENWVALKQKALAANPHMTTTAAAHFLQLTPQQIRLRVCMGGLIPDKTVKITKGARGSYYTYFFLRETLEAYKKRKNSKSHGRKSRSSHGRCSC